MQLAIYCGFSIATAIISTWVVVAAIIGANIDNKKVAAAVVTDMLHVLRKNESAAITARDEVDAPARNVLIARGEMATSENRTS